MPRPLRIEYENAYYHVMNRGQGRQNIFHGDDYFIAFLSILEQAHQRFGLQVLSYCLMSNHYHLLVKTPEANLGRAMRHIYNIIDTHKYIDNFAKINYYKPSINPGIRITQCQ